MPEVIAACSAEMIPSAAPSQLRPFTCTRPRRSPSRDDRPAFRQFHARREGRGQGVILTAPVPSRASPRRPGPLPPPGAADHRQTARSGSRCGRRWPRHVADIRHQPVTDVDHRGGPDRPRPAAGASGGGGHRCAAAGPAAPGSASLRQGQSARPIGQSLPLRPPAGHPAGHRPGDRVAGGPGPPGP